MVDKYFVIEQHLHLVRVMLNLVFYVRMIVRFWYLRGLQQHQEGLWVPLSPAKSIHMVSAKNSGPCLE